MSTQDAARLDWLQAQQYTQIYLWRAIAPGDEPCIELTDLDGDTLGTGPDLRTAIDAAMGRTPQPPAVVAPQPPGEPTC